MTLLLWHKCFHYWFLSTIHVSFSEGNAIVQEWTTELIPLVHMKCFIFLFTVRPKDHAVMQVLVTLSRPRLIRYAGTNQTVQPQLHANILFSMLEIYNKGPANSKSYLVSAKIFFSILYKTWCKYMYILVFLEKCLLEKIN